MYMCVENLGKPDGSVCVQTFKLDEDIQHMHVCTLVFIYSVQVLYTKLSVWHTGLLFACQGLFQEGGPGCA